MLYSRISNQGGRLSSLHCQFSFTNLLLLYQHHDANLSACKPQHKVLFGTQLYKPRAFFHLFLFPEKGGGEDW